MPFGYLEFSRAIGRDLCPPAHVCMRARAAAGGGGRPAGAGAGAGTGPGSGSGPGPGLGLGSGSLPGLIFFESGLAGMDCKHTRSATRTGSAPLRIQSARQQTAPRLLGCQQLRLLGCQQTRLLGLKGATFHWVRTRWPLLERYIKRSDLSIEDTPTPRANNSLSLFLSKF